jgi:hypothetical protein
VLLSVTAATLGVLALAAAMAGYLFSPLGWPMRMLAFAAAACSLYPDQTSIGASRISFVDLIGAAILVFVMVASYRASKRLATAAAA